MEDKFFKDDVFYMENLIGKRVSIETIDNKKHEGIVYVIDPVHKTVVLLSETNKSEIEFIVNHAIRILIVVSDIVDPSYLFNKKKETSINNEEVAKNKLRLIKWLKHMFINVEEEQDCIKVESHLRIEPPYNVDDCLCDNTIILQRIRNIIELMPADFH